MSDAARLSPHFLDIELMSRGRPFATGTRALYEALALRTLEPIRAHVGSAVAINCGQRLPDHNASVGGETNSFHLPPQCRPNHRAASIQAVAADFHVPGWTVEQHAELSAWVDAEMRAGRIPMGGLHTYRTNFIHVDNRGTRARWKD